MIKTLIQKIQFVPSVAIPEKKQHSINVCHHLLFFSKYNVNFSQLLQVFGLQKFCKLVLGLSGSDNQGGTALLRGATDTEIRGVQTCPRLNVGFRPALD